MRTVKQIQWFKSCSSLSQSLFCEMSTSRQKPPPSSKGLCIPKVDHWMIGGQKF
ncbi:unnamed protein product [Periconia digitata]|uniref:Uncharacterized protein n=1 Tax=Periconia digitata TaxID=1303443 RepID=A0A9W4UGF4_9PLEO|nr:unnamed protein product [Periconia digitata]